MKLGDPTVRRDGSIQAVQRGCEDIALRLLEPNLSHATREHLAALVQQQSVSLSRYGPNTRVARPERCVVAELIHGLELVGEVDGARATRSVRVGGAYPLPWGFRDNENAIEEVIRLLVEDACRSTTTGFITVSIGYDVLAMKLLVTIVDTRSAVRGRRRCAVFAGSRRTTARVRALGTPANVIRFLVRRAERLGGRIEMGLSPLGYSLTALMVPIQPIGPLLHGEADIGRDARISVPTPTGPTRGRALLIDRSVSTLRSLGVILRAHGIDAVSAPHAGLAVEVLRCVACDSVWIDIEDPLVTCGGIRECLQQGGFTGQIVGLSAHRQEKVGRGVATARFDIVIAKPVSRAQIDRCISELSMRKSTLSPQQGKTIDALQSDGGADIRGVIAEYVAHLPQTLAELDHALEHADYQTAERLAHMLKAGTVFGFREVSAAARTLESALRSRDQVAIGEARDMLNGVVQRLEPTSNAMSGHVVGA